MLFFFFFSCEERLFHRSVRGDDYCPASQETEVRGEAAQLPHTSQPALRSEVPVEQQNLDAECILLLLVRAGVYSTWGDLEEFMWIR